MKTRCVNLIASRRTRSKNGFTLIELTIVVVIIGVITALAVTRPASLAYWKEENFIRRLAETITYLHYQAVVDQAFYRIEFDMAKRSYRIGVLKSEDSDSALEISSDIGNVSVELAAYLNPSLGSAQTFIPPPSLPSLMEPVQAPNGMIFRDIRSMRGEDFEGQPFLLFSPRGFSEFAVLHLVLSAGGVVTILVNPFTGNAEVIRADKDFEWTYGRKKT